MYAVLWLFVFILAPGDGVCVCVCRVGSNLHRSDGVELNSGGGGKLGGLVEVCVCGEQLLVLVTGSICLPIGPEMCERRQAW